MNRRQFTCAALASASLGVRAARAQGSPRKEFQPSWDSLNRHQIPAWYTNAKLGIFIHWGLYSVPAWATPTGELGKIEGRQWFERNPYAEWYLNTLRIKGSPTYRHHVQTYGAGFDYYDFAREFDRQTAKWDPSVWARLFARTGARYVVLTSKHHDGFRLWPSQVSNPRKPGVPITATRDLVGDLVTSVRGNGMRMGLYYSGGLDWTFTDEPIRSFEDVRRMVPQGEDYARYADAHWTELTDRYQPALMWNDISYPKAGKLPEIFAHYYNTVPDGAVNNRFGVAFSDFTTPEYAKYDKITEKKWESCRGLGYSFGYNQVEGPEQVIAPAKLIELLVDIVSKNGNLLLNIGPRPDGSISDIQMDRLDKLAGWLRVNGEGIFDTRPWVRPAPDSSPRVRFTRREDQVYAFLLDPPKEKTFTIPGVIAQEQTKVRVLGSAGDSEWKQQGQDLIVSAAPALNSDYALSIRMTPAPWQLVRD